MNFLRAKAQFYHTLASLVDAGVLTARAFRQRHPHPFRRIAAEIADAIENGEGDLGFLFEQYPHIFSRFEARIVAVGQRSGRLDTCFRELGDWFDTLARLRGEILSRLMYPLVMYHAACILIPFINVVLGMWTRTHALTFAVLAILIPWILWALLGSGRPGRISGGFPLLDAVLLNVPWLGTLLRRLNYARFFRAMSLALEAGTGMVEAIRLAADTCTNTWLARRLRLAADVVETEGIPFARALRQVMGLPGRDEMVETVLETGETAGRLVESTRRIADIYTERSRESLQRASVLLPTLVYLLLMLWMAMMVLRFWGRLINLTTSI